MTQELHIVGGGMAGSEAAWQAAKAGIKVVIHEMRPKVKTFAHQTDKLGEMVCSNSFRSDDHEQNAVGLLHWEMLQAGSLVMQTALHPPACRRRRPRRRSRSLQPGCHGNFNRASEHSDFK